MYVICGKVLNSDCALKNHVRWRIKTGVDSSLEDFYSKNFASPSLCPFCGVRNRKLISIFKGWGDRCDSDECKQKLVLSGIQRSILKDGRRDFIEHFRDNVDQYVDLYNVKDKSQLIQIPYNGKFIKRKSLLTTLSRYVPSDSMVEYHSIWPTLEKTCVACCRQYSHKFFNEYKTETCGSRSCVTHVRYNKLSRQDAIAKNITDNECVRKTRLESLTDTSVTLTYNGTEVKIPVDRRMAMYPITVLCSSVFEASGLTTEKFISHCLGDCCMCSNTIPLIKSRTIIKRMRSEGHINAFCSKECYFEAKRRGKYPISEEAKLKSSKSLKEKILTGDFTPNVTNSWAKSRMTVGDMKFRSSWEAAFWMCNQNFLYEKIRIPYVIEGIRRTYIVDFFDVESGVLYEIKPDSNAENVDVLIKKQFAIDFCRANGYRYVTIGNSWFYDHYEDIVVASKQFDTLDPSFNEKMEQFNGNRYENRKNRKNSVNRTS